MRQQPSLMGRAVLAVGLMIGFYVLAVVLALFLLWLPYAEWTYAHRLHPKLAIGCVVSAVVILWSILPRRDKFEPPGPRLDPTTQPALFREIESVARATGQTPPAEVYLVNEVNAWVTERGGWLGQGGRRVMGLGLPLMQLLRTAEFRGVLAHEFGHYHGGDTKLGPWVYKTRAAIGRTLEGLGDSIVQKPFLWYGKLFLRITHAISRRQEFAADALAAGVAGRQAMVTGLQKVHSAAQAFDAYWRGEAVPVLSAGYRPALTDGFARFLGEQTISRLVGKSLSEAMQMKKADAYDTHPALPERIAALEVLPAGSMPADDPPAINLLTNVTDLEHALLVSLAGHEAVGKLRPVYWEQVGEQVFLPQWRAAAAKHAKVLTGITPTVLPERAKTADFAKLVAQVSEEPLVAAEQARYTNQIVGCALAMGLHARGHMLRCVPGAPVSFHTGQNSVQPFTVFAELQDGKLTATDWQQTCAVFGIGQMDLGRSGS